jgi:hypothetical protein
MQIEVPSHLVKRACEDLLVKIHERRLERRMELVESIYNDTRSMIERKNRWRKWLFLKPLTCPTVEEVDHHVLAQLNDGNQNDPLKDALAEDTADVESQAKDALMMADYCATVNVGVDLIRGMSRFRVATAGLMENNRRGPGFL